MTLGKGDDEDMSKGTGSLENLNGLESATSCSTKSGVSANKGARAGEATIIDSYS